MLSSSFLHRPVPSKPGDISPPLLEQADNVPLPSPSPSLFDPQQIPSRRNRRKRSLDASDYIILLILVVPILLLIFRFWILRINIITFFRPRNLELVLQKASNLNGSLTLIFLLLLVIVATISVMKTGRTVYLLDHVCWQPPPSAAISHEQFIERARASQCFTEESLNFQHFLLTRNGLGNTTYLPHQVFDPFPTVEACKNEALTAIIGVVEQLFSENPFFDPTCELDILIVSCPSFTTQPSLCSCICNHFKLKPSIRCYTLTGMGTASGLLGIDLAQDLLQTKSHLHAIVVSTDNCTANWYRGNDRAFLVANTLWRWGASAVLLSNLPKDQRYGRYKLLKCIRTNMAYNDDCFNAIKVTDDSENNPGMLITKDLRRPMGVALKMNINMLCPYIMSLDDLIKISISRWLKTHFNTSHRITIDFKKYITHFCVHAGGIKLINDIKRNLSLSDEGIEPAFATFQRYGLLSGPSPWYQLAYLERKGKINRGDNIWQLSYGSGFNSVSATWIALRGGDVQPTGHVWPELIDDPSFVYTIGPLANRTPTELSQDRTPPVTSSSQSPTDTVRMVLHPTFVTPQGRSYPGEEEEDGVGEGDGSEYGESGEEIGERDGEDELPAGEEETGEQTAPTILPSDDDRSDGASVDESVGEEVERGRKGIVDFDAERGSSVDPAGDSSSPVLRKR